MDTVEVFIQGQGLTEILVVTASPDHTIGAALLSVGNAVPQGEDDLGRREV